MTVTVSLKLDEDTHRVKAFIYQDAPEFRSHGDYIDLAQHEALELLNRLGLSPHDSQGFLEQVLSVPQSIQRRQFELSAAQEAQVRQQFFSGAW
jgi:hypothetical protein